MWQRLKNTTKPILLYGMGNGADKVLQHCKALQIPIAGVFASDGFARHNLYQGYTVISYQEAKQQFGSMIVLTCFGTHLPSVMQLIQQIAQEQELYMPDFPVVGTPIFDVAFARTHRSELEQVYNKLADEQSRQTFQELISYKLSGNPSHLDACCTPKEETYQTLLKLSDREHYVDLGAYRGDTVEEFLAHTTGYASILAVEPERNSFKKLQLATQHLPRCRCIPAAIGAQLGTVAFASGRGRGSLADPTGTQIDCQTIDHLLQGNTVTFLKLDVEGQEAAALAGGRESICRQKPKLLVSAYHRSEDLFCLPLQILQMRSDYRLYLRHYPCYPAWDVNYILT